MSIGDHINSGHDILLDPKWRKELSHLSLLNPSVTLWEQDTDLRYRWVVNPQLPERERFTVGKRDVDLMELREDAERVEALKQSVLDTGIGRREEVSVFHQGKYYHFYLVIEPILAEDGQITGIRCASADITTQKEAEAALKRSVQMTRLQHEAARYLGETLNAEQVYDRFHELLMAIVPHDGLVVSSYDPEQQMISCEYAWTDGQKLDPSTLPRLPLNPQGEGMQSRVIRSGESLLVNDVVERVQNEEGTFYSVDGEGHVLKVPESGLPDVRAAIMTPIRFQGQVLGVVQVMSDRTFYTDEQLEVVEAVVAQMSAAVHNAKLYQAAQHEIAERQKTEEALRQSEERFRVLANTMPTMAWTAAPDGTITYASNRWFTYCGLTPEENATSWPQLVLHPDDYERCLEQWNQALAEGIDYQIEVRNRRYDGEYRWFLTRATPVRDADGQLTAWYGTTTDIHDRKQAEQNLQFLFELGTLMRGTEDPEELLWTVVQRLADYLQLTRCYFGEIDPESNQLVVLRDYHRPHLAPLANRYELATFNPQLLAMLQAGQSIVTADTQRDPLTAAAYDRFYRRMGIRARVGVPLLRDGRLAGTLWASKDQLHEWSEQEISVLETAASRAWLAFERARLTNALRASNENLEQQVQVRTAQVRHLASALTLAEQQERRQLARELHDSTGQLLTALQIYIKLIEREIPEELEGLRQKIREAVGMVQEAQHEVRAVSHAMRPPSLDQLGLRVALEELCYDFARRTGLNIQFQSDELPAVDEHISINYYRFLQEALNNTIKHSHANSVQVVVGVVDKELIVMVEDDGVGFNVRTALSPAHAGTGLIGLKERFYLLGGEVEIYSSPGRGTRLVARRSLESDKVRGEEVTG